MGEDKWKREGRTNEGRSGCRYYYNFGDFLKGVERFLGVPRQRLVATVRVEGVFAESFVGD